MLSRHEYFNGTTRNIHSKLNHIRDSNLRVFFESLWKSSVIFANFRKIFGNVRLTFREVLENFRKSSEGCRKSSENHQKCHTLARSCEFYVLVARRISHLFTELTHEILFLPIEHKIHIFSSPCNILSFYSVCRS